jgi:hypothetical protein
MVVTRPNQAPHLGALLWPTEGGGIRAIAMGQFRTPEAQGAPPSMPIIESCPILIGIRILKSSGG